MEGGARPLFCGVWEKSTRLRIWSFKKYRNRSSTSLSIKENPLTDFQKSFSELLGKGNLFARNLAHRHMHGSDFRRNFSGEISETSGEDKRVILHRRL
jgi:hypothetical protein